MIAYASIARKCGQLLLMAAMAAAAVVPGFGQAAMGPAFDVVSIKPNKSGSGGMSINIDDGRYVASNLSLKSMIQNAYGLQTQDQIVGLPGWGSSARFDVEAKMDAETIAALKGASREQEQKLREAMMQAMLADRFQLKVHAETKELPIYTLVAAKGGPKLAAADPANKKNGWMSSSNQTLTATGIEMAGLCDFLSGRLHRKVVDNTGLAGSYDFKLQWSPDEAAGESAAATGAAQLPSMFTAVQEQLGLKLESGKGPVDTVVVDHVAMPSEN
jgi:uncharacterized protein (TIGR03435 family)